MSSDVRVARNDRLGFANKLLRTCFRPHLERLFEHRLDGPLIVEFDPTTACNYSCPECISAGLLNKQQIPADRIESLMHEFSAAGVIAIVFIGGGEPLAHKCMPRPIELAYQIGMSVGLTTNGSLLERNLDVVGECASWTRVSIDAGTSETYRKFRPNGIKDSFAKVLKGMEDLARRKRGTLGYSFLLIQRPLTQNYEFTTETSRKWSTDYTSNVHEMFIAARLAKEIGCDYFEFKPMVDSNHYLVPLDRDFRSQLCEQVEKCKQLEDDNFEVLAPDSIQCLLDGECIVQPKEYDACPSMELRTLVTPSGVFPCPYHRGRQDKLLGTVNDGPFDEFWKSAERKKAASLTDPRRDCKFYCGRHELNVSLKKIGQLYVSGESILDCVLQKEPPPDPFI